MVELVNLCNTRAERQAELRFVFHELSKQVITGDGLLTFRVYAVREFAPEKVLKTLLTARKARHDLWHVWSALVQQLLEMDRLADALKTAKKAAALFPLLPRVQLDLASVFEKLQQHDEEITAIRRALDVNSRSGEALRQLADAVQRAGRTDEMQVTLERAIASEPRNVTHRGALAHFLWSQGLRNEAAKMMVDALRREPGYEWGWRQLAGWAELAKQPKLVLDAARNITRDRPRAPKMWLQQAEILAEYPEHYQDCLAAIDQAIQLDPREADAYGLRARVLASHGEFEQAIDSCRPKAFRDQRPLALCGREAVIESQRGNIEFAIEKMQKVIQQDDRDAFAWSQLAEWYREKDELQKYLQAATKLSRLAPNNAVTW